MKCSYVLALAALMLSSSAYAQEWRYRPSELRPAALEPSEHLLRSGTGFLEVGAGWMARRSAEGGVEFAAWLEPQQVGAGGEQVLALEDGGWLSLRGKPLSASDSVCELRRFDATARQLWTARSDVDAAGCAELRLFRDRRGGGWLLQQPAATEERRLLRLGEDGQLSSLDLSRLPPGSVRVLRQRRDTSFDLIVVAAGRLLRSQLVEDSAQTASELIALPTNSALAMTARHAVASDGSLWWLSAGMGGDRRTSLLRFDPEGRLLWGRILDLPEGHDVIGMSLMSDVVLGVLSARRLDRGEPALRFFGINGDLQATRPLGEATANGVVPQIAIDPVIEPAIITVELSQEFIQRRSSFNVLGNTLSTPVEHGGRAFASSWPQVALQQQVSRPLAAFDFTSGHVDLVLGEQGAALQSVDLEGRPSQLGQLLAGASTPRALPIAVAGNTERVCAGPLSSQGLVGTQNARLACVSRASGASLYEVRGTLQGVGSLAGLRALPKLRLDAQQRALILVVSEQAAGRELALLRIAADGARGERFPIGSLASSVDESEWRASLDAEGQVLFALADPLGGLQVSRRSATGAVWQRRLAVAESVLPVDVLDLGVGGAALIVAVRQDQASRGEVWLLSSAGDLRDRIPLGNNGHQGEPVGVLRAAGDDVLVAFEQTLAGSTRRDRRVGLLNPQSGQWIWQREELRVSADRLADVEVDAPRQRVLLLAERASQPLLTELALIDGEPGLAQSLRCTDRAACRPRALQVDEDGFARVLSEVELSDGARVPELVRTRIAGAADALPVLGLEGVWYTPETSGQGLVLNVVPNERALLGGWFTFSEDGSNQAAQQRWYSLDARYPAGARRLDLNLRRASAAAFDTEGGALIEEIGDAQLWLLACDQAVLRYRFERGAEAGLTGEIPLQRLGPADGVCTQTAAGGAISPYSGSWYQPTQSGQGLLMEVLPATASRPGLLSAGWFTFDPPGRADDAFQQRWFFVQGTAPSAEGETREVTIYAALGAELEASATLNVREVGRARVRFVSCGQARFDYRFDAGAGDFAGREGAIDLYRLAGCAAGAR